MQFQVLMQQEGLSNNGEKLKDGVFSGVNFDPSRAPSPEMYFLANYQLTAYYGKISVTKNTSINLSLFGLLGLGLVQYSDATEPALNVGFGQKFYFNENLALRFDLGVTMFQGPDPTSFPNLTPGPELPSDAFDSTLYFRSFLTAGLVVLL
jgi:outer membrane beta-barrel protein